MCLCVVELVLDGTCPCSIFFGVIPVPIGEMLQTVPVTIASCYDQGDEQVQSVQLMFRVQPFQSESSV